jgi:hypothetical protein
MDNEKFDHWCIVELFGHQKIAGMLTDDLPQLAGGSLDHDNEEF